MTDTEHPMRAIRIEKVTFNVGAGKDQKLLDKSVKLIEQLTGKKPVLRITQKRIQAWGIRPGLPVGCKLTIRDQEKISELLPRLLEAKERVLRLKMFDELGNLSFGIPEYIDIQDAKYDPDIGIIGLQISVTLVRPGFRIKNRRLQSKSIHHNHAISRKEAIDFMKKHYNIQIQEEIDE
jgi:large subunit ribosomal protein L5